MPINVNIYDEADLRIQNEIRILYHKLKKQEEDKQFITDCESYFKTGLNRPNILTETEMIERLNKGESFQNIIDFPKRK